MEKKHDYTTTGFVCLRENTEGSFAVLETLSGSRLGALDNGAHLERENPAWPYYNANPIVGTAQVELSVHAFNRRKPPRE